MTTIVPLPASKAESAGGRRPGRKPVRVARRPQLGRKSLARVILIAVALGAIATEAVAGGTLRMLAFALLSVIAVASDRTAVIQSTLPIVGVAALLAMALRSRRLPRRDALTRVAQLFPTTVNRLLRRAPDTGRRQVLWIISDIAHVKPRGRGWAAGLTFGLLNWIAYVPASW